MKKTMLFSSALVALAMFASCQKEEFIETTATATGVTEFTATIESTKTAIDGYGNVTWVKDDEITVTDAESKSAVYVAVSAGASTTFTLKPGQTAVGSGPYTATYGDITKQKYSATGANCPLEATTADAGSTTLHFSSKYAVLKITAKSSEEKSVKTVVVKYGNSSSILDCEKGETLTSAEKVFYVAVRPSTEAASLSVSFYTADKMAKKTRKSNVILAAKDLLPVTFESLDWSAQKTFKAVYKETDGSLTFYYDTQSHDGEGAVDNNLPPAATLPTDWGYNSNRSKIKSVVINASVEDYPFLTSTAYMFQGMTAASSISGAEHLDVSNVTNMSYMFTNFGSQSETLTDVPKVSGWDTGMVEDMSKMFQSYGSKNTSFIAVPDVRGWNTGNVTDMSYMFNNYGGSSLSLNTVPDVSKWNTGEVKNMKYMFQNYGKSSTDLDKVPIVSGWNVGDVNDMQYLFENYGSKSPNLKTAPAVSGWNVSNVKDMDYMFQNYGNGSVEFSLNLSNWHLENLPDDGGNGVFNCIANGFDVDIPGSTSSKINTEDRWYYGHDKYIEPAKKSASTDDRWKFKLQTN